MAELRVMRERLRVLYVHTATHAPLGADTWVHAQIIRHLDRATHELHLACRTEVGGLPTPTYEAVRDIADLDIIPVNLGAERSARTLRAKLHEVLRTVPALRSVARLVVFARRSRIDVVHTSDRPRDAFVSLLVARAARAPCVVHVHVGYNPDWMGPMLRWSLHRADALVAVSQYVATTLVDGGHAAHRVHVVLNGIDMTRWTPGAGRQEARAELGIAADTAVITTVCRLFPEKGPGELIRAVCELRRHEPDVVLLVVGEALDPAYLEELGALVRSLDLGDHVTFLGRRPDVASIMAAAEVFAMPSHEEPFGLVFVEAMAMCLPTVGLDDGGTVEVVEAGRTGLLSDWGDVPQLARNLLTLLDDPDQRSEMGVAGRLRAEQHFTVQRVAIDVAQMYRLVLSTLR